MIEQSPIGEGGKVCAKCGQRRSLDDFYDEPRTKEGKRSWCKVCWRRRTRENRDKNLERTRERDREYRKRPEVMAKVPEKDKKSKETHGDRYAARRAVQAAIDSGKLTRLPCEVCGDPETHGHHDDYSKPLDVRWLCEPHHHEHHAKVRRAEALARSDALDKKKLD